MADNRKSGISRISTTSFFTARQPMTVGAQCQAARGLLNTAQVLEGEIEGTGLASHIAHGHAFRSRYIAIKTYGRSARETPDLQNAIIRA
jgi:hypothetical protein